MYIYNNMNQGRIKRLGKKIFMETFPTPNNMRIWKLSRGPEVLLLLVVSQMQK